ncbi:hypothetical protein [Helicobacter salomonis]|uniref:hypothetical protein n=1 Tax=Helicobacter salomonis TaxID=56878 RepID=UPI001F48E71C|nr:hypothetical protein [Helicobacter salomonis]
MLLEESKNGVHRLHEAILEDAHNERELALQMGTLNQSANNAKNILQTIDEIAKQRICSRSTQLLKRHARANMEEVLL